MSSTIPLSLLSSPFSLSLFSLSLGAIRNYLSRYAWPPGLQNIFIQGLTQVPMRFFICDDSSSMMMTGGNRIIGEGDGCRLVKLISLDECVKAFPTALILFMMIRAISLIFLLLFDSIDHHLYPFHSVKY